MNPSRIETITRLFADRKRSRRQSLAAAQGASPQASPIAPDAEHGPEMLFVQSFQSGRIVPVDGSDGRFTVTLEHGLGQTIYFSDRPDRVVGAAPTRQFLDGLGFSENNPPNAALIVDSGSGETDLAVVELFAPVYDETTHTVAYDVAVLDAWERSSDMGFSQTPVALDAVGATFGTAHVFIDDCADGDITCGNISNHQVGTIPNADFDGWCYSWQAWRCLPCQPWIPSWADAFVYWDTACTNRFPEECTDACRAEDF